MIEEWRSVLGFEGLYEISDCGNVRGLTRTLSDGRTFPGKQLSPKRNARTGHLSVRLCRSGFHKWSGVHRLVLEAFVGPAPIGCEGAHNDGNPANNVPSNLRWDTPAGNAADRKRHGTEMYGSKNPLAKLNAEDVATVRRLSAQGMAGKHIAARMNVTAANVSAILTGKTWRHP